jgi:hypothetical protein
MPRPQVFFFVHKGLPASYTNTTFPGFLLVGFNLIPEEEFMDHPAPSGTPPHTHTRRLSTTRIFTQHSYRALV